MKTTFNISFYCRASKANKDGYAPVELGINLAGRRVFLNLPRKERPTDFNKPSDDLSVYLSAIRLRVNEIITEITLNGQPLTADMIRSYLRNGGRQSYTVKHLLEDALERTVVTRGTYQKYLQVAKMFLSVVDSMREVSTLNPTDAKAFETLLRGYKASTRAGMLTKIKTLVNYGVLDGYIPANPFRNIKISRPAPTITYLTEQELERIWHFQTTIERLEKVRDLAVFQASCGLAYCDLAGLKPQDLQIKDGIYFISKPRNKTGVFFIAPIIDGGEAVFKKYGGTLPMLSNQKLNSYLKELQDLTGITKNLTTHLFRRTYAIRLMSSGVRVETIARAMGHQGPTITLKHYSAIRPNVILEEVSKAFGK